MTPCPSCQTALLLWLTSTDYLFHVTCPNEACHMSRNEVTGESSGEAVKKFSLPHNRKRASAFLKAMKENL
jgi:hypothetical protein